MAPVLLAMTAFAVDYGRVSVTQSQLQAAIDNASLAATQALSFDADVPQADLQQTAETFFTANIGRHADSVKCSALKMQLDRENIEIRLSTTCNVPTAFGKVLSEDGYDIALSASTSFSFGDADIAFMIDTSTSMAGPAKLGALKSALRDAIDTLMAISRKGSVRVALAPYSSAVNAGPYAAAATGRQPGTGGRCVTERSGIHAFTDAPPTVAPVESKALICLSAPITPLTDDKDLLTAQINTLPTIGTTAGHLGAAWAWYMVSPRWRSFWPNGSKPKPDGVGRQRAVVLMTDGMFNTHYSRGQGDSAAQGKRLCDSIKKEGVLVYTVAFKAPSAAQRELEKCSSGKGYYFKPENSAALKDAYRSIANSFRRHILSD